MGQDVDLSRADLNLFVIFEAVMEEGHVRRAAERLNLSPSAVSHALTRLRRMLNDPLFLRTSAGVVPTSRARELGGMVQEVLQGVRRTIAAASPFDPATSRRRFNLGVPAGEPMLVVPGFFTELLARAPNVDLNVRSIMPFTAEAALDANEVDVAITPMYTPFAPRFHTARLFVVDFVTVMRKGHPHADRPDIESYCSYAHAVMSHVGEFPTPVDKSLAASGLERRVALTIPGFIAMLAAIEDTDLLAAVPRAIAERYAHRFGLVWAERPVAMPDLEAHAVTRQGALQDAGIRWLVDLIQELSAPLEHV